MKAASLTSPRLQRVLKLLADGQPHTTRDIVRRARVMAASTCVSELRFHGAQIACVQRMGPGNLRLFVYTMTKAPKA